MREAVSARDMAAGHVARLAARLDEAARTRTAVAQLGHSGEALTLAQAYEVQAALVGLRQARGERLIGVKMGFTSEAKRAQMQIHDLIIGRLTDAMRIQDGGTLQLGQFIHPRIEPELAFRLARPLAGTVTAVQARAAVQAVAPALEIVDSRYVNFRFSLPDVIADNSSSAAFVVGEWQPLPDDLARPGIRLCFNGVPVESGTGAAIMGDPLLSLVAAARLAAAQGLRLEAGWVVMAGGATAARELAGEVRVSAEVEGLGSATLRVSA